MFEVIDNDKVIKLLSEFFNRKKEKLYVVGGAVRDALMLKTPKSLDIDLTGTMDIALVLNELKSNGKIAKLKNKKLQVIEFIVNGVHYDYARMRVEEYQNEGSHNPSKVEFTASVEEDSVRRDFTINAMYYDTHSRELIDPRHGALSLETKAIFTVLEPKKTLAVDPARILRLVELSCRLNFKISSGLLQVLKSNFFKVSLLSEERLKKECNRINAKKYKEEDFLEYEARVKKLLNEVADSALLDKIMNNLTNFSKK